MNARMLVRQISGSSARIKIIEIYGMPAETVEARLVAAMEDR